jgi:hypothetical protein
LYLNFKDNQFLINPGLGSSSKLLKKEFFTNEMIAHLINYSPKSWMGPRISEYQEEVVPLFIRHLQEGYLKIWADFKKEYPELAEKHKIKNYIGRKAYLDTVVPNVGVFEDKTGNWSYDGEILTCENFRGSILFSPFEIKSGKMSISTNEKVIVTITDNAQVNENTVFVD